jgi:hypothetical protein
MKGGDEKWLCNKRLTSFWNETDRLKFVFMSR